MNSIDGVPRLSPVMASRKHQVLAFIRIYHRDHGVGPSLSEIAAAVCASRSRVQDAIRKLAREGRLHHRPGETRGVRPAESRDEALRVLRDEGWIVLPDRNTASHPNALPLLDVIDEHESGTITGLPVYDARAHDGAHGKESETGG